MIRCLSFHASYRCRHAGACCRAGWTIPLDADGLVVASKPADGACAFLHDDGLCAIHRLRGHHSLPVSCRMFPRSVLMDARGTFMSLSHFCPTAAALLFEPGPPVAIVEAPPSLADVGPLDGLDARDAWPPLLRPGVLMDLDGYDAWERLGVELLTRDRIAPDAALAALDRITARIAAWTPDEGPLVERVRGAYGSEGGQTGARPWSDAGLTRDDMAVKRWLAARLFACWVAYQKDGLAAIVDYLHSCARTFAEERAADDNALEAIRRADLRIMHT